MSDVPPPEREPSLAAQLTDPAARVMRAVWNLARQVPGVRNQGEREAAQDEARLVPHRMREATRAAIVFVHGFSWYSERTWGDFPGYIASDPSLEEWDLVSIGYSTGLTPDLRGVWASDPDLATLATYLRTRMSLEPLDRYAAIAFVAHSMGGLVVQRAVLDSAELAARTSHVLLFGTPSGGLAKARWGGFLKAQIRDMGAHSAFITDLRSRWDAHFAGDPPFRFFAVAGDRDVFVPPSSSLEPFPPQAQLVVPGNHLEIVQADGPDDLSVRVVARALVGDAAPAGPWNSARVALEERDFERVISVLRPHTADLDDHSVVDLALALDATGRRDEAVRILRARSHLGPDAKGVLAGRLKRSWMATGQRRDGDEALALYRDAYDAAVEAGNDDEAMYHGINVAFLELVFRHAPEMCRDMAERVLEHCDLARAGYWREATRGEALLYLGEPDAAVESYSEAVASEPPPRALDSIHAQAHWVAEEVGDHDVSERIDVLFRSGNDPGTSNQATPQRDPPAA